MPKEKFVEEMIKKVNEGAKIRPEDMKSCVMRMSDKYIKCPECNGEGKFYLPNGETRICQSCAGVGYLERVEKEDPVKEVTNDDIANMLKRIHHENGFIINCIARMAGVGDADIDRLLNDWDEEFKKAKGELI